MAQTLLIQLCGLVLAPLLIGIVNRGKAMAAGRNGPPVLQPYFDMAKMARKGATYSVTTGWIFRAAPSVILGTTLVAMLIVPVSGFGASLSFAGDIFLFTGLMALARFAMIAAAMDTGSAFEGMGAAREMMISAIAEPALLLIWVALAITTGETSIQRMLGADLGTAWQTAAGPAVAMLTAAWFLLLLAENNRMPVDDPTTHLELTMVHEVMILDHSGPDLAYLTYASALKIWVFAALMVSTVTAMVTGPAWVDLSLFGGGMVLVALLVAAAESTMARLRMVRVPQLLMLAVALGTMSGVIALGVR